MISFKSVNQRLNAQQVISYLGLKENHARFIICPVHNDMHPSMRVYKDSVHCFSCGAHFDLIGLTAHVKNVSQPEAVKILCKVFSLPFDIPLHNREKPRQKRDITIEMISLWVDSVKRLLALYVRIQAHRGVFCNWAEEVLDSGFSMSDIDFFMTYSDWIIPILERSYELG